MVFIEARAKADGQHDAGGSGSYRKPPQDIGSVEVN
jgi:hypothetical protein